jgi:hypothetical protein
LEVSPVRELRTLKRTQSGSRVRSVQGRLSIEFGDEEEVVGESAKVEPATRIPGFRRPARLSTEPSEDPPSPRRSPPTFHPLAYRSVVADWPVEWRERWGRRANALEEKGLAWRDAETQAFVEIWHVLRREHPSDPRTPRVDELAADS